MSPRGRVVLAVGVLVWIAAWLLGSHPLYPVAAGLVLAVPVAVAWVRLSLRGLELRRHWPPRRLVEGDDVAIELVLERSSRLPLPVAVVEERIGALEPREVELRRAGHGGYAGSYALRRIPRGRYEFAPARVTVADPWQLAEASLPVEEREALVVYPRLVELERLFFDGGAGPYDGRHLLLRRPSGFELHSVREHQSGDSLRRVHWPSTARRGVLMVKEVEDSPRDEVAVLLDGDAAGVAGTPPDSSFDAAVRVAGSILLSHVRRGRRCALVLNSAARETQTVAADGLEWERALDLLAAVRPDAPTPASALLASGAAAQALQLVVVTSRLEAPLVHRLLERALSRRPVAVVHVEAASFAGRPGKPEPALLRLQAAGVPVAVVRHGDDLWTVLHGPDSVPGTVTKASRRAAVSRA